MAEVQKPAAAPHKHGRKESVSGPQLLHVEEATQNIQVLPHDFSKDREPLGWKINTAPQTSETLGKELLSYYADTFVTEPPMGKVIIKIGVGIEIKVSKLKQGVKVKDAIEAVYTKYGKKFKGEDPEDPYLVGFQYDPDDAPGTITAVLKKEPGTGSFGGGKKSKKNKDKS